MNKKKYYQLLFMISFLTATACGPNGIQGMNNLRSTSNTTTSSTTNSNTSITTNSNTTYVNNSNVTNTTSNTNNSNVTNTAGNTNNSNTTNSNILLSVDFEHGLPQDFNLIQPAPPGSDGSAQIVTTKAAHGTHSLALISNLSSDTRSLLATDKIFPLQVPTLYLRFYIFLNQPNFKNPEALNRDAIYLMFSDKDYGNIFDSNTLQFTKNAAGWNWLLSSSADDFTAGHSKIGGTSLSTTQWTCVEFMIDTQNQALHVYINGTEDPNLAITKSTDWLVYSQKAISPNWLPNLKTVYLGYRNFWTENSGNVVYIDDVAFASSRIGCLSATN